MYAFFVVLHVLVCVVLCVVVLLQSSKGGGLAGAFGGGGMPQQIFGTRGMTTILHKLTIYCAVGFFITSATLFALTAQRDRPPESVVQDAATRGELPSNATPPMPAEDFQLPPVPSDDAAPTQEGASGQEGGGGQPGATSDDDRDDSASDQ